MQEPCSIPIRRKLIGLVVAAAAILSIPAAVIAEDGTETEFTFSFDSDAEGWTVGFADLPVDHDQSIYELEYEHRPLPNGLEGSGIYIQGHNRSDDLFMFLKRQVGGLRPNTEYAVSVSVDIATNVPTALIGIGGSPGESVFVKGGASTIEPATMVGDNQHLRMNIDKGNQSRGGEDMVVIGNVAHPEVLDREYRIKTLDNTDMPLSVIADNQGRVWLIVGTDSGFEGLSALYYARVSYKLNVADQSPVETPSPMPTHTPKPNPTPVAIEKVDADPVDGATVIQPHERTELTEGDVTLMFPVTSRARTYQAMVEESDDCVTDTLTCTTVSIYSAEGEAEPDARFIFPVEITVQVSSEQVSEMGGAPVVLQAYAMGAITFQIRDRVSGNWGAVPHEIEFDENGDVIVTTQVRRLGYLALVVNAETLEEARMRVSAALGTPTATPIPTVTPTPAATATSVPTPTSVDLPVTGGSPITFGILLALTAMATLMTAIGMKTLSGKRG